MNKDVWLREVEQSLAQVKLKSQPAFAQLYDMTNSRLYGLVLKIIPDENYAADVLQDAYQKIWLNAQQHRADLGSAWSWICQLVRNQAIDHHRKHNRQKEDFGDTQPELYGTDSADIWPEYVDLNRCLQTIREEQKVVILNAYVYGWSHSELTARFDAPLGTLKSWIRRGLKELKACLEA